MKYTLNLNNNNLKSDRGLLLFGVIGPILVLLLIAIDIALSPWFSWYSSALSDLGVHPYSYLFNGGLLIEAIFNLLFAVGLKRTNTANGVTAGLLGLSGISLGLVGIFNENHEPFHLIFALVYFILFPIAIILFSRSKKASGTFLRPAGYIFAVVGLIFILAGILEDFNVFSTSLGLGFYEMVEAIVLSVWSVCAGAFYFRKLENAKPAAKAEKEEVTSD